jgi:adenylate kinase
VIVVAGIDGSGKSTVARQLARELSSTRSVSLVSDELEHYEGGQAKALQPLVTDAVRRLVGRYAKKAHSLANYKVPKLVELLLRDHLLGQVRRWYRPDLVVMDGSPLLNMVAWAALYKPEAFDAVVCSKAIGFFAASGANLAPTDPIYRDFPELRALRRLKLNRLNLPRIAVFLDVEPAVACRRIEQRGEARQVHETEEHLGRLRSAYRTVLGVAQRAYGVEVSIVPSEGPLEEVAAAALARVRERLGPTGGRPGGGGAHETSR